MPTVMNHPHLRETTTPRTNLQKVCLTMGIIFIVMGLLGAVMPGMLGMHLSVAHNLIHLLSGALAIWFGYSSEQHRAYNLTMVFGVAYGLIAIAGYMIGNPGYPTLGNLNADQHLWRVIPNVMEFGTVDHVLHLFISAVFLTAALVWRRTDVRAQAAIIDVQRSAGRTDIFRSNVPNSESDLKDAPLGASDINRIQDLKNRHNFEDRV
jgi:hypothetical protein